LTQFCITVILARKTQKSKLEACLKDVVHAQIDYIVRV